MRRSVLAIPDAPAMRPYLTASAAHAARMGEAPLYSCVIEADLETSLSRRQTPFSWLPVADVLAVYVDHGIDAGMADLIVAAEAIGLPVELRTTAAEKWAHAIYRTFKGTQEQAQ